jgi:hypothetical protein
VAVTKRWSESSFRRGESAEDVYWVDAADESAATFATGVPQQNTSHLLDPRLLVQGSPSIKTLVLGTLYEVRVFYVRLRGGENKKDDPLDESPTLHWQIGSTSEPVDADAKKNPLVNSVGDRFPGLSEEFPTLHLTYTRNEGAYDVQKALAYGDKVNSDSFSIRSINGDMLVDPGQALCRSITAEQYALDAQVVPISYNFEFRADGFKRRILDQGFNGIYDDNGTKRIDRFSNGAGKLVNEPVLLNGGLPLKKGNVEFKVGEGNKTPVAGQLPKGATAERGADGISIFLKFDRKLTIDFAGLNL